MKNVIVISLSLILLCYGCTKENGKTPDVGPEKKYAITLNISDFSQITEGFDARDHSSARDAQDTLRDYVQHLYYVVNGPAGFVKIIHQRAADSSFGIISDSLQQGLYRISILGANDSVLITPYFPDPLTGENDIALLSLPGTDVFFKSVKLNVEGPVDQEIHLERVVAKLRVNITDKIPAEAKRIGIVPYNYPLLLPNEPQKADYLIAGIQFSTGEETYGGQNISRYSGYNLDITDSIRGTNNFSVEVYLLAMTPKTLTVMISCTDAGGNFIARKYVSPVPISASQITVLTGKLFDAQNSDGKGVNVVLSNPEWNSYSPNIPF